MATAFFACFPPVPPTEKTKGPEDISVRVFKMKSPIRKELDCPLKILIKGGPGAQVAPGPATVVGVR